MSNYSPFSWFKKYSRVQITWHTGNFGSRKQVALLGLFWRHRIKVILNKMLLPASKFSVSQVICRRLYLYTSPRHHPLSHYPLPPRPIVRIGQASHGPHKPRIVANYIKCPPLSSIPARTHLWNRSCSNKQQHPCLLQHVCCLFCMFIIWWWCLLFVLAETENGSQAPYIPLVRYVP